MKYLPLTLDSPAENLALDEALLDAAESGEIESSVLRLWEPPTYGVVLGRSSSVTTEVHLDACRAAGISVLRRSSGGGTILTGPGCLMYAVVLDLETYPQLQAIDAAHRFVLGKLVSALAPHVPSVQAAGTSDLVLQETSDVIAKKFSGNAMRRKLRHILYHGTLLYDFDLELIPRYLASATRTPAYREDRQHLEFVINLPLSRETLVNALTTGWQTQTPLPSYPEQLTQELAKTKYTDDPKWVIYNPVTQ